MITHCYEKVVHWKRNMIKVPSGKSGNLFVKELTRLFQAYVSDSVLQSVAVKAAMVLPSLVLQKPSKKSKNHPGLITGRLKLWQEGQLTELLHEGQTIQSRLNFHPQAQHPAKDKTKQFTKLMGEGKVKAALRLLEGEPSGGSLPLDQCINDSRRTVLDILKSKHPPPSHVLGVDFDLETTSSQGLHPILFDQIDGSLIRSTVQKMDGAAGPSGLDTSCWKRLCTAFKNYSTDLCDVLTSLCRKISTEYLDPSDLAPLVACRLIVLDKCLGVHLIGIGECA